MNRRGILAGIAGSVVLPLVSLKVRRAVAATEKASVKMIRTRWRDFLAASATVAGDATPLNRAPEEWREELPHDAFIVLFEDGTERPFSSILNDEKRPGIFVCRARSLPLFSTEMKYDSGTGWPSFFTSIAGHLETSPDFKLIWPRTEYHCLKCGGHQGHLFKDGPASTGERWCNNGVGLHFIPLET